MLSPPSEIELYQHLRRSPEKQKLNFFCSALFHMKTGVCRKHLVNVCLLKHFVAPNVPQTSSDLIV